MTNSKQPSARALRIAEERRAMGLRPWEFSPSEVMDEPCPYPPNSMGHASWLVAREQWRALRRDGAWPSLPAAGRSD